MKKIFLSLLLAAVATVALCQTDNNNKFRKSINLDLLGGGFLANVSFDMRLKKGVQDGLGFRAGIGGFRAKADATTANGSNPASVSASFGIMTFPMEVNYLIGKNRSAFETGIGIVNVYVQAKGAGVTDTNQPFSFDEKGFGFGGAYLKLGYRFQPLKNGITFNVAYTPIINSEGYQNWFGLGLGFSFR